MKFHKQIKSILSTQENFDNIQLFSSQEAVNQMNMVIPLFPDQSDELRSGNGDSEQNWRNQGDVHIDHSVPCSLNEDWIDCKSDGESQQSVSSFGNTCTTGSEPKHFESATSSMQTSSQFMNEKHSFIDEQPFPSFTEPADIESRMKKAFDSLISENVLTITDEKRGKNTSTQCVSTKESVIDKNQHIPFCVSRTMGKNKNGLMGANMHVLDVRNDKYCKKNTKTQTPKGSKRALHSIVEKKYRTNINERLAELKNTVPTIRYTYKKLCNIPLTEADHRQLNGMEPARKLNKASILHKATEYIKFLENENSDLKAENARLQNIINLSFNLQQRITPLNM